MPSRSIQAKSLFLAALDKPEGTERDRFIADACKGDEALHREVLVLLRGHYETGEFLAQPAWDAAGVPSGWTEQAGTIVAGRYKLIEKIGEGGMGSVWMAEQREPVKRMVALKVVRLGVAHRQVAARFEAERQALAVMDHPNIAKILDAGESAGVPFFIMELVKGVPINTFCDERRLATRERLELFVPVCEAIQHAHQKGIIHRDIKPGNILVALYDGRPVPKVIDFGIAKALGDPLTERTLHTHFGAVVGTPQYMSPEQAETNQLDIDTRSDVYSLGVVLYELLAGSPPFDRKSLGQAALLEVLRIIREVDPPPPSSRLSTDDGLPGIAARRATEPAKLTRLVRGELDWIAMRALEKNRDRRYGSANALGEDVRRFLAGEAVEACPPSRSYRLRKFVVRNRGPVLAATLLFLALVAGIVGTSVGMVRARESARKEREAKELAGKRADTLQKNVKVLTSLFNDLDPREERRQNRSLRQLLADRLSKAGDQLGDDSAADPLDVASMRQQLAIALNSLGQPKLAVPLIEKALEPFVREGMETDQRALAGKLNLAVTLSHLKEYDRAIPLCRNVIETRTRLLGRDDPETLVSLNNLAVMLNETGRHAEALPILEEIIPLQKAKLGPAHFETNGSMNNLAMCYQGLGRSEDCLKLLAETLEIRRKHAGANDPDTLSVAHNLAHTQDRLGKWKEALATAEDVLARQREVYGESHAHTLDSLQLTAQILNKTGEHSKAAKAYGELTRIHRTKSGPRDEKTLYFQLETGEAQLKAGHAADAEKTLRDCLAGHRAAGPNGWRTFYVMNALGSALGKLGQNAEAEKMLREGHEGVVARVGGDFPQDARDELTRRTIDRMVEFLESTGRADEAESWKRKRPPTEGKGKKPS